jgi:hypothetical protein
VRRAVLQAREHQRLPRARVSASGGAASVRESSACEREMSEKMKTCRDDDHAQEADKEQ